MVDINTYKPNKISLVFPSREIKYYYNEDFENSSSISFP